MKGKLPTEKRDRKPDASGMTFEDKPQTPEKESTDVNRVPPEASGEDF